MRVRRARFDIWFADQKVLWRSDSAHLRCPAVWSPGEYPVIDSAVAPGSFVFCAVLAHSRWRFVRFATDQKASTALAMTADALAAIGEVAGQDLGRPDGLAQRCCRRRRRVPTPGYMQFASQALAWWPAGR